MHLTHAREPEDPRRAVVLVPGSSAMEMCVGAGPVLDLPGARESTRDVAAEPLELHLERPEGTRQDRLDRAGEDGRLPASEADQPSLPRTRVGHRAGRS